MVISSIIPYISFISIEWILSSAFCVDADYVLWSIAPVSDGWPIQMAVGGDRGWLSTLILSMEPHSVLTSWAESDGARENQGRCELQAMLFQWAIRQNGSVLAWGAGWRRGDWACSLLGLTSHCLLWSQQNGPLGPCLRRQPAALGWVRSGSGLGLGLG